MSELLTKAVNCPEKVLDDSSSFPLTKYDATATATTLTL